MNDPAESIVITGVFKRGRQDGQSQRNRYDKGNNGQSDMAPWAKECRQSLKAGNGKEWVLPQKSAEGTSPTKTLILAL